MNTYCDKIRPLISEYIDDTLDARRKAEVVEHLPSCADCRRMAEDFRTNKSVMASLPLRQTSSGFDAALAARLAAVNEQRVRRSWLAGLADAFRPSRTNVWRPAFASIAAASIVAATVVMTIPQQTHPVLPIVPASPSLIQQCVTQHRNYVESQPLTDLSAQTLAGQLDNSSADNVGDDDTL